MRMENMWRANGVSRTAGTVYVTPQKLVAWVRIREQRRIFSKESWSDGYDRRREEKTDQRRWSRLDSV